MSKKYLVSEKDLTQLVIDSMAFELYNEYDPKTAREFIEEVHVLLEDSGVKAEEYVAFNYSRALREET